MLIKGMLALKTCRLACASSAHATERASYPDTLTPSPSTTTVTPPPVTMSVALCQCCRDHFSARNGRSQQHDSWPRQNNDEEATSARMIVTIFPSSVLLPILLSLQLLLQPQALLSQLTPVSLQLLLRTHFLKHTRILVEIQGHVPHHDGSIVE